jgi:hypothetical protein
MINSEKSPKNLSSYREEIMEDFQIETVMDEVRKKILVEGIVADALTFDEVSVPYDLEIPREE